MSNALVTGDSEIIHRSRFKVSFSSDSVRFFPDIERRLLSKCSSVEFLCALMILEPSSDLVGRRIILLGKQIFSKTRAPELSVAGTLRNMLPPKSFHQFTRNQVSIPLEKSQETNILLPKRSCVLL